MREQSPDAGGQNSYCMTTPTSARIVLTLPLPPSINEQYATVNGRRVTTAVARRFKRQVQSTLRGITIPDALLARLRQGYLALFLDFYFTTPLKRDLDGGLKITQDALCDGLGINDNRVVDIHLVKHIDPLHPRLYVELEVIADWQFDTEYILLK
jgi:crossover junction endodeoxyribonuclease RusA